MIRQVMTLLAIAWMVAGCGNGRAGGDDVATTSVSIDYTRYTLFVVPGSLSVTPDGVSRSIRVLVYDATNAPASDVGVNADIFDAAYGTLQAYAATTDAAGEALFTYVPPSTVTVQTAYDLRFSLQATQRVEAAMTLELTPTATVETPPYEHYTIYALPDLLTVTEPEEQQTLQLLVRDETNASASGIAVNADVLSASLGTLDTLSATTNGNGIATFTYTAPDILDADASSQIRFRLLKASSVTDAVSLLFAPEAEPVTDYTTYSLNATHTALTVTSASQTQTFRFVVRDADAAPVADTRVSADVFDAADGTLETYAATTDDTGVATFTYTAPATLGTSRSVTLHFFLQAEPGVAADVVLQITSTSPDYVRWHLDAVSGTLTITRDAQQNRLRFILRNETNATVSGATVNADVFDAAMGTLDQYTVSTDANGEAAFEYTAPDTLGDATSTTVRFSLQSYAAVYATVTLVIEALPAEVTVEASNGATDTVVPYAYQGGTGDATFDIRLEAGMNLIDFSQVSYYEEDQQSDALMTLSKSDVPVCYVANKSKQSLYDTGTLYPLFLEAAGLYRITVEIPSNLDIWEVRFVHESQLDDTVRSALEVPQTVYAAAGDDPLYPYQWHLKNSGQSAYVIHDAVADEDINVEPAWALNIYGRGVTVAVVDQGVEINHPDLVGNVDALHSWNYLTYSYDTTPDDADNAHGTAVAGIIAASAGNGIGGRGVAPKAKLVSYNMLEAQSAFNWSLATESLVRGLEHVDIYNNSWGRDAGVLYTNPPTDTSLYYQLANQMAYGVKFGRDGKGAIYVKSAGNDRLGYGDGGWKGYWSANFDPEQVDRYTIVVGASNADGNYAWYSNPGENLLLNAPGGAERQQDTPAAGQAYLEVEDPMIVTTDLTGNDAGYDYRDSQAIDYHFDAIGNENYDYTDRMGGTNAAGPIVAGVAALMLEANPDLTWRDVRYILATTATKNGSGYHPNSAGHTFSSDYGFGRVDAAAAVEAALLYARDEKTLSPEIGPIKYEADDNESNASTAPYASVTFEVNTTALTAIDYVNVQFSIKKPEAISRSMTDTSYGNSSKIDLPAGGWYKATFSAEDFNLSVAQTYLYLRGITTGLYRYVALPITDATSIDEHVAWLYLYEDTYRVSFTNSEVASSQWSLILEKGEADLPDADRFEVLLEREEHNATLVPYPNGLSVDAVFEHTRMGSNRYLDTDPGGIWKLHVRVPEIDDARAFRIEDARLELYGRAP